jgi:ech hydrogenase subunit B
MGGVDLMTLINDYPNWFPFANIIIPVIVLILLPFIGLLVLGIDRKVSARMQNRIGPPVLQPFYDLAKLFSKQELYTNTSMLVFAYAHLGFMFTTAIFLVFRQDIIVIFFTLTLSMIFLVLGAFSTPSPYSYLGGYRELIKILCIETLFLFVMLTLGVNAKTFLLSEVIDKINTPLIIRMPLSFVAMIIIFLVAMEKTPFNIPGAHSEIVQGPLTDYSGRWYGLFKLSHALEIGILLMIMYLFFVPNPILGIIMLVVSFLVVVTIGNTTTRTTYKGLFKFSFTVGIALVLINLIAVVVFS